MRCLHCSQPFPVKQGIPILLTDITADTALDIETYEADHPVSPEQSRRVYRHYEKTLQHHEINGGDCLEIGAGTGNLTYSLVTEAPFDNVHCSDISYRFLRRLLTWVPAGKASYWVFDASQQIPFADQSMRAVFGHSVLHHLLMFETVVSEVYRVLQPGGVAIFGEPIMDFYAQTSFIADVIWQLEERDAIAGFSPHEMMILRGVAREAPRTARRMRTSRAELAVEEDKHMFLIDEMRSLAAARGFREFTYTNAHVPPRIGDAYRHSIAMRFHRRGLDATKLAAYSFLFDSATDTLGTSLGDSVPYEFGFLTFAK